MPAMRRRLRDHNGQTTSEYLGALLLVSVIIAAVSFTGVGDAIATRTKELICQIGGGKDCKPAPPPLSQCVVAEATDKLTLDANFNVRFVKVKLEGGVEYVRQKRADGTVAITVKLPTTGGIGPPLKKALGVADLDGTVKLGQTPQVTFILPGDAAANTFVSQVKESTIAIAAGPVGAWVLGKHVHIDVPPVESVAYELTAGANGSVGVDAPGGYASGSLDLGSAIGVKKNLTHGKANSGDITVYYRISAKASAEGGLLVGEGMGGSLAGDLTMSVVLDSHGKPKTLTLLGQGGYEGKLALNGKFKDVSAALKGIDALNIKANAGEGQKAQFQIDLPLDDPQVQAATLAFLQGVNPITGSPADRSAAGKQLWDAIQQKAKVEVRTYDTSSTQAGVGVDLGVGGGGVTLDSTGSDLTGAQDYVPGQGFVPSQVCHK